VIRVLVVLVALVAGGAVATAEPRSDATSKKDRERAAKTTKHRAPPAPGTRPPRLINLYNGWTHEWVAVEPGQKLPQAVIDRFLRDHYTNVPTKMEPRLIEIVVSAAEHFKRNYATVVSAFRHPKYNLLLRKKGRQVARDSHHTHGNAVDFNLPNVRVDDLHAWAKDQKIGGVGLYPQSKFIHMDTGPIRYWSGE
jgi:uncharacterized protein YcbK (DUF882 family)